MQRNVTPVASGTTDLAGIPPPRVPLNETMTATPSNFHTPVKMNVAAIAMIEDINARQDDALRQLDELNQRIESLVELCGTTAKAEAAEVDELHEPAAEPAIKVAEIECSDDAPAGADVQSSEKRAA